MTKYFLKDHWKCGSCEFKAFCARERATVRIQGLNISPTGRVLANRIRARREQVGCSYSKVAGAPLQEIVQNE